MITLLEKAKDGIQEKTGTKIHPYGVPFGLCVGARKARPPFHIDHSTGPTGLLWKIF